MNDPARWMNAGALICLGVTLGGTTCALVPYVSGGRAEEIALSTLGFEVFLSLLAVALVLPGSVSPVRRLGLGPGRLRSGHLALLAVGTLGLSHALDTTLHLTRLRDASALADLDAALSGLQGSSLLLAFASLALAPAVGEELLCRGLVQRGLQVRLGAAAGIALSAAFFGALHMEPIHSSVAMLLGLYLGAIAWLAGSIRASIFCHLANNAAAIAAGSLPALKLEGTWTIGGGAALAVVSLGLVWWRAGSPPPLEEPATPDAPRLEPPEGAF